MINCNICKRKYLRLYINQDGICKSCKKRIANEAAVTKRIEEEKKYIEGWNAAEEFYTLIENALKDEPFAISHSGMSTDELMKRSAACDAIKKYADNWENYELFDKVFYAHCTINKRTNALENPLFHIYHISKHCPVDLSDMFSKLKREAEHCWTNHYLALANEYVRIDVEDSGEYQDLLYRLYYCMSPFIKKPNIILEKDYLNDHIAVFANSHRIGSIYDREIVNRWFDFREVDDWGLSGVMGSFRLNIKALFQRNYC